MYTSMHLQHVKEVQNSSFGLQKEEKRHERFGRSQPDVIKAWQCYLLPYFPGCVKIDTT